MRSPVRSGDGRPQLERLVQHLQLTRRPGVHGSDFRAGIRPSTNTVTGRHGAWAGVLGIGSRSTPMSRVNALKVTPSGRATLRALSAGSTSSGDRWTMAFAPRCPPASPIRTDPCHSAQNGEFRANRLVHAWSVPSFFVPVRACAAVFVAGLRPGHCRGARSRMRPAAARETYPRIEQRGVNGRLRWISTEPISSATPIVWRAGKGHHVARRRRKGAGGVDIAGVGRAHEVEEHRG